MNYDNWKQMTPEEKTKTCGYCGEESEEEFCNKDCKKAYMSDN